MDEVSGRPWRLDVEKEYFTTVDAEAEQIKPSCPALSHGCPVYFLVVVRNSQNWLLVAGS
jgi:hypothetical protein